MARKQRVERLRRDRDSKETIVTYHDTITLSEIETNSTHNGDYLRLRNLRGQFPLSFYDHYSDIRILNMRDCNISSLPGTVTRMTKLRYLDISGNHGIILNWKLGGLNLQRLIYSSSLLQVPENYEQGFGQDDIVVPKVRSLADSSAEVLLDVCSLPDLEALRSELPRHLRAYLVPEVCAECGLVSHRMAARRMRRGVICFESVPLMYTFCSPLCLERMQKTWHLEEQLNSEKRALRMLKFGATSPVSRLPA